MGREVKSKAEIIASLPERFKKFDFDNSSWEPTPNIDTANRDALYNWCRYEELLHAFTVLIEKYS